MTAASMFEIRCDCAGCPTCPDLESVAQFGTCGRAFGDYGTATQVRRRARSAGWRTGLPGGKDRCDDCVKGRKP